MGDVIFLNPSVAIPADVATLTQLCKDVLLSKVVCRVIDEELVTEDATNTVFDSKNPNWFGSPAPKIEVIESDGTVTRLFSPADYSLELLGGRVNLTSALTADKTLQASYSFFPFTDPQLVELVKHTIAEISTLIWRPIGLENIPVDYRPVICKRFYTNVLKVLILEARDFFSITVAGRTINKTVIVPQINVIIDQNERQVLSDLNILRHFNKTNRITPVITLTKTITSEAFNGQITIKTINSDAEVA